LRLSEVAGRQHLDPVVRIFFAPMLSLIVLLLILRAAAIPTAKADEFDDNDRRLVVVVAAVRRLHRSLDGAGLIVGRGQRANIGLWPVPPDQRAKFVKLLK
jgi:hypothetical protein